MTTPSTAVRRPVLGVVTAAYLAVVGWITLSPQGEQRQDGWLWGLARLLEGHPVTAWISFDVMEFTANVLLFLPAGICFALLLGRRRWWLAIVIAFLLTVGIELAQQFIPNRVPDPRDIVANTVGAIVGAVLVPAVSAARRASPARA